MPVNRKNRFSPQFPYNYLQVDDEGKLVLSSIEINTETPLDVTVNNESIPVTSHSTLDVNITNTPIDVAIPTPVDVTASTPIDVNVTNGLIDVAMISNNDSRTAFGERLVATNYPVAGWTHAYNINADLIKSTTTGSGTVTSSGGFAVISTTNAINSSASINTYRSLRYVPGTGAVVRFTAIFTPGVAGSKQIIGIGDANDGFFFGYNGETFGILRRSNGVDTWTPQANWSEDTRSDLDTTKGNVYEIVYQWLGFGMIKFNLEDSASGNFVPCHEIEYANLNTDTSIRNPTLPIFAYVENTSNNTNVVLRTPSAMGFVQGFIDVSEIHPLDLHRAFVSIRTVSTTNETPILVVRAETTFQGIANRVRSKLMLLSAAVEGTKPVVLRLYKNSTTSGGSFSNYNASTSTLSSNTSPTSFSGGRLINSFQLAKTEGRTVSFDNVDMKIGAGDVFLITSQSTGANYDINVSATMLEQF